MADPVPPPPAKKTKKRGGCRGCIKWFGILLLILLIITGILLALVFRVPQRLGLLPNAAARQLMATPDRAGGRALLAEARARGMSTKGVYLYLMPYKENGGSAAVLVLDSREGFSFGQGGGLNPVGQVFSQVAGGAKAGELGVKYVTAVYLSAKGQDLMNLSASRADALAFANGGMSEQQFMAKLNGDINLPAVVGEQIDSMKRMMQ